MPASDRSERELTDVLDRVITEFAVRPVSIDRWMDVGRPWNCSRPTSGNSPNSTVASMATSTSWRRSTARRRRGRCHGERWCRTRGTDSGSLGRNGRAKRVRSRATLLGRNVSVGNGSR
ncbi:hypothetical protein D8S78_20795 [Natrialba swarupiae]|nr:hypothetical protein [Natrialba swarupiae]